MTQRWEKVDVGQTKDQVNEIMGDDHGWQKSDDGHDIYTWAMKNSVYDCGVRFSTEGLVEKKACSVNEARAANVQAAQQAFMQGYFGAMGARMAQPVQPIQPIFTPAQYHPLPSSPSQTNCTTNFIGGTAYTNCH